MVSDVLALDREGRACAREEGEGFADGGFGNGRWAWIW